MHACSTSDSFITNAANVCIFLPFFCVSYIESFPRFLFIEIISQYCTHVPELLMLFFGYIVVYVNYFFFAQSNVQK